MEPQLIGDSYLECIKRELPGFEIKFKEVEEKELQKFVDSLMLPFKVSVVPGPSQAGEYVYEADEEGEDWDGDEEEGDYEDYGDGEAAQEYEGVYQGGYFDGVNHAGYYAGANYQEGINNLYEDVY